MIKMKTLIILFIIYLLSFISINYDINIFYPYYLLKDLFIYPVTALKIYDLNLSDEFKEERINNLEEEIIELKKINNINNILTDFDKINATVIERNREYWFNTITINKGSNDGISIDMAVINSEGLIGRISNVRKNTSDIKLITTNDVNSKISVVIKGTDNIYGLTKGYDSNSNLLKVIVDDKGDISKDLIVETTGMGGVFPKGIPIGKVDMVIKDSDSVGNIVLVRLSSNIKDIRYVSVLQRK